MRYEFAEKPGKCPACGSERMVEILWGMPIFSPELDAKMKSGEVELGGCCQEIGEPDWYCGDCEAEFFSTIEEDDDE